MGIQEWLVLGLVQGFTEWLPISSEGMVVLVETNIFKRNDLTEIIHLSLFLHLGTFLAALIYFFPTIRHLTSSLLNFQLANPEDKKIINFLIISTIISGSLGLILLKALESFETQISLTGKLITGIVSILLIITALLQIKAKQPNQNRTARDLTVIDSIILGLTQACAALPGFSRSGLTVSALLLRNIDKLTSLKLSFLMSLPIVLAGNILLNLDDTQLFTIPALIGVLASFVSGFATIHLLLKIAARINFGKVLLLFGILGVISVMT